jgi:TM2 domain-containing membrane protein YozV
VTHVKDPRLLCLAFPLGFAGLAYFTSRLMRTGIGRSLWFSVGCAWLCFVFGVMFVVLNLMTWSY